MGRLIFLLLAASCGGKQIAMTEGEAFSDKAKLVVELDRSPTGGATFDFCPRPRPQEVHWGNAAWLAFLSANEYSHLFYVSSLLGELGFAADGGIAWPTCAKDLRVLRGFEQRYRDPLSAASHAKALKTFLAPHAAKWGACARGWFEKHYDGTQFPAPSFEKWLIQTPHPGEHLEFFSGGEITDGGRAFAGGSTQVTFMRHRTLPLAIIAFRGTEPNRWNDISTDLKAWKVPLAAGWGDVHAGFHGAYESIGPAMRAKLEEYKQQKLAIWVTGHSLGGGLATLMAAELLRRKDAGEDFDLRGLYTFGSPRVGNKAFRAKLMASAGQHAAQLVRFRNGDDVVTAVPRLQEFEHVGQVAHLREDKFELGTKDPPYAGMGSLADHDIVGWLKPKKAVSGYYRRVLAVAKGQSSQCAAPVAVKPPLAEPATIACKRLIDLASFTSALGEKAPLTVRDDTKQEHDAAASCSLIRGGAQVSKAEQARLLEQKGRLGVLPGEAVCQISAYCWAVEESARFDNQCATNGGRIDPATRSCIQVIPQGAHDVEIHRFFDEDTRCVLAVRGGPSNVDNEQIRTCAKVARDSIGAAQIAP